MAGAAAASSAATGGIGVAEVVQITQVDNKLTGPNNQTMLRADLTGDLADDLASLQQFVIFSEPSSGGTSSFVTSSTSGRYGVAATFSGSRTLGTADIRFIFRYFTTSSTSSFSTVYRAAVGSLSSTSTVKIGSFRGLIPITFSDTRINSASPTNGFVDVESFNVAFNEHVIQIHRLVFDDANTAEPGGVVAGGSNFPEWVPPAPEIEVLGNGVTVLDGDTTPSAGDDTDFGNVAVGEAVVHTFQIRNSGEGDLTVTSIEATPGDFAVTAVPMNVAAGTTENFNVTFVPSSLGAESATITITNNDADEGTYTFEVSGVGVADSASGTGNPVPPTAANPNLVRKASLSRKIKKFKKKLADAKEDGNVRKARAFSKKIKKLKKQLMKL